MKDSLLKKHGKHNPLLLSIKSDMVVSSLFFYNKRKHWHGILINDASLVNQSSQFVHNIRLKNFDADSIGSRLFKLGITELKQYTYKDLAKFYNQQRKLEGNKNAEYELPNCMGGGFITITLKKQSYSYADCIAADKILQKLPEMERFYRITNYLQVVVYPLVNKKRK